MNKKYELTNETIKTNDGHTLHRIKALKDFDDVNKGDLGGFIESEDNLSQKGNCWVYNNARVYENARIFGNAHVYGHAHVYGNARIFGNARVSGNAKVCVDTQVYGNARVSENAKICGNAKVTSMDDYSTISNFGTQYRTTTFFRCEDNKIRVSCGCFYGTIPEFRNQVKDTRKGKIAEEYLLIADLMEKHFNISAENVESEDR